MKPSFSKIRQIITILLAFAGIGTMVYYTLCDTECSYLKGDIFEIDLQHIGIFYMVVIALLAGMKKNSLLRATLATGLGGEAFLLGFQVNNGIYCPYCLAFMGCVVGAFTANYEFPTVSGWQKIFYILGEVRFSPGSKRYPLILFMLAGFGFLNLTFSGSALPAYAADPIPRTYGQGEREIRIYTDYFCSPCRDAEPKIEKLLEEITRKRKGRILFIDTPMHSDTVLYAKYYIYALEAADGDIQGANHIRRALFEAAGKGIRNEIELADFLKTKKINFIPRDVLPFFRQYTEYIKADKIRSTPTIVVITPAGASKYAGAVKIITALEKIRI